MQRKGGGFVFDFKASFRDLNETMCLINSFLQSKQS